MSNDFLNYLKETRLQDFSSSGISALLGERGWLALNEYERIDEAYNFVRDEIRFGYNKSDNIPASEILHDGYDQRNIIHGLASCLVGSLPNSWVHNPQLFAARNCS